MDIFLGLGLHKWKTQERSTVPGRSELVLFDLFYVSRINVLHVMMNFLGKFSLLIGFQNTVFPSIYRCIQILNYRKETSCYQTSVANLGLI